MKIAHSCPDFDKAIDCIKEILSTVLESVTDEFVLDLVKSDSAGAIDYIESARSINSDLRDAWHNEESERKEIEAERDDLLSEVSYLRERNEELELKVVSLEEQCDYQE